MDCIFSWNILEITRKDIYFRELKIPQLGVEPRFQQ